MASSPLRPCLVVAGPDGSIYDEPDLLMVCRKGDDFSLPRPDELMPLPEGSRLFLLPGRKAVGFDEEEGTLLQDEALAVAAVPPAGHVLTAHSAWEAEENCPALPAHPYGAVGFANNRLYICAKKVRLPEKEEGVEPALPDADWHYMSANSLREGVFLRYHGACSFLNPAACESSPSPESSVFVAMLDAARQAKGAGKEICLHLWFFPGFSDTEEEYAALESAVATLGIKAIMLDNLPLEPQAYLALMQGIETGPALGYANFRKRLQRAFPEMLLLPPLRPWGKGGMLGQCVLPVNAL